MGIALPHHHNSLATRDFQSSISIEAPLQGCHLDVQGLLHPQLLSSAVVQHCCLLPVDQAGSGGGRGQNAGWRFGNEASITLL